jgi:uncharacterized protein YuzE
MAEVGLLKSIHYLLAAPSKQIWTDYDEEAHVLYISFRKPQQANDSILEENAIYHYHDQDLVGITVLNASTNFEGSDAGTITREDLFKD